MEQQSKNPYSHCLTSLSSSYEYYSLATLQKDHPQIASLPVSIKILLECAIRNCDNFTIKPSDVNKIIRWEETSMEDVEIPFKPARVILQDFTGVPAVVDLAGMRDAVKRLGGDPNKVNPLCPVDLVIDHSVQADVSRSQQAKDKNEEIEFSRNYQRFEFLKWGQTAFDNFLIVPPGSGIVHQVNLEYLARVLFQQTSTTTTTTTLLYPDSVVGTDSHTTMINGLGVMGWGVGGIEAEAVMMGQNISMVLPKVVGFKFIGQLGQLATATDLVLTCVAMLRKRGVVGKFVEFFGEGVHSLSLADRATVSNMAPEYGATMGFFPLDEKSLDYLRLTNRNESTIQLIKQYFTAQGMFITPGCPEPTFSGAILQLDLSTVEPCLSGPKRPHDMVLFKQMKNDFNACMKAPNGFKGFGVDQSKLDQSMTLSYQGNNYTLKHGAVVIAAITSCTNTSNPDVILAAGLLAQNAVNRGLSVAPYIKTTLSPGSGVVETYIQDAGLTEAFDALGFNLAGFGCMTCIGNSGELDPEVNKLVIESDLTVTAVLSGNRNFEARVHPLTKGNYLASPPLVVAYALAGTVDIDFDTTPIGTDKQGKDVFLKDIWPTRDEITDCSNKHVKPSQFKENYEKISKGTDRWNALQVEKSQLYSWKESSTYIHNPPFFQQMQNSLPKIHDIKDAYVLALFGDSITTDHISPAGTIAANSAAAKYLSARNIAKPDFNTYGARRGNDEVMARGTFANTRIINKLMGGKVGPLTVHVPSGETMNFFDASQLYINKGQQSIILAGNEYGSGSSRDWAAKGPYLLGVKCVIAASYERIHRSNLVGMGILPCEFLEGQSSDILGLTGLETFSIELKEGNLQVNQKIQVVASSGVTFDVKCRLDTDVEVEYFKNGGILHYVLRNLIKA